MKRSILKRIISILCTVAICVSVSSVCFFISSGAGGYSDEKYYDYANIDGAVDVPTLFRQDSGFSNDSKYPLVIKGGTAYVPLEMFFGFGGVVIEYSESGDSFYIQNKNKNLYISFNIKTGYSVSQAYGAKELSTENFYNTIYVPAFSTAEAVGLICETLIYDNPKLYCLRIRDSSAAKSFTDIVKEYVSRFVGYADPDDDKNKNEENTPPSPPTPSGNDPDKDNTVNPTDNRPNEPAMGRRTVYLAFPSSPNQNTSEILDYLKAWGIKAVFFCNAQSMLEYPSVARRILVEGHTVGICPGENVFAKADGETENESADMKKVIADIEYSQEVFLRITKKNCRLFYLPNDLKEAVDSDEIYNSCGLASVSPNLESGDLANVSGFVAAAGLIDALRKINNIGRAENAVMAFGVGENGLSAVQRIVEFAYNSPEVGFRQLTEGTSVDSLDLKY